MTLLGAIEVKMDGTSERAAAERNKVLEREVKLRVCATFVMPDLEEAVPGAFVGPVEKRLVRDVYYDTAAFRLARWGCTLRFREGEGWTAKIPVPSKGRALSRHEVTFDAPPDRPPPRAVELVRSLTRGQSLHEVAHFSTSRFARAWRADGDVIVELADDHVEVNTIGGASLRWREIEVELVGDTEESQATELVDRLEAAGARVGGSVPKLVRAVGDAAAGPPDVVQPELPTEPTTREVIQAALARSVAHLLLHLPAARLGQDIEGVHQARVATRRLRSDLRTFQPLLDPQWTQTLEDDLRWLTDYLGAVRDADVLLARLRAAIDAHPELDPTGASRVIKALEQQRRGDNKILRRYLASKRADQLLDQLVEAAADPMTAPQADDSAIDRLPSLVRKRWRRLRRAVEALDDEPLVDDLHRIRILAKRTRYAAEAVAPAVGGKAKAFARSMTAIQDALGKLNDAAVAETWLAGLAEAADGPTAFTAGRLAQLTVSQAVPSGHAWQRHYRKAGARKRQAWMR